MSPVDLARRLDLSPGESTTLVCLLAAEGKVKIRLVELDEGEEPSASLPARSRRERARPAARELEPAGVSKR